MLTAVASAFGSAATRTVYRHFIQMFSHIMFMYWIVGCWQTILSIVFHFGVAERDENANVY